MNKKNLIIGLLCVALATTSAFAVKFGTDLADLKAKQNEKTPYQIWLEAGYEGSEEEFLYWIKHNSVKTVGLQYEQIKGLLAYRVVGLGTVSELDIVIPSVYRNLLVMEIGENAFSAAKNSITANLTSVKIPNTVHSIGKYAFYGCTNLKSVEIPDSVTNVGYGAFSDCDNLSSVHITDLEAWCNISFDNITYSSNPLFNGANLYLNEELVTDVIISDSLREIKRYTFFNYKPLQSLVIPDSVTSIWDSAFQLCSNLTSVVVGSAVTSIDSLAFTGCANLSRVYYKGTAEDWQKINIHQSNDTLLSADRYYYSETHPKLNEEETAYDNNYWRYVDGVPTVWELESV